MMGLITIGGETVRTLGFKLDATITDKEEAMRFERPPMPGEYYHYENTWHRERMKEISDLKDIRCAMAGSGDIHLSFEAYRMLKEL